MTSVLIESVPRLPTRAQYIDHVVGGTVDLFGQENRRELRHRALLGEKRFSGKIRHASLDQIPTDAPLRPARFFNDFDTAEGDSDVKLKAEDVVEVIEVRRGNVLNYLVAGDYIGEECFLDSDVTYRHKSHVTAMEDSDLGYLTKEAVMELKEEYPEIEHNIMMVLNQRDAVEGPRRFFAQVLVGLSLCVATKRECSQDLTWW